MILRTTYKQRHWWKTKHSPQNGSEDRRKGEPRANGDPAPSRGTSRGDGSRERGAMRAQSAQCLEHGRRRAGKEQDGKAAVGGRTEAAPTRGRESGQHPAFDISVQNLTRRRRTHRRSRTKADVLSARGREKPGPYAVARDAQTGDRSCDLKACNVCMRAAMRCKRARRQGGGGSRWDREAEQRGRQIWRRVRSIRDRSAQADPAHVLHRAQHCSRRVGGTVPLYVTTRVRSVLVRNSAQDGRTASEENHDLERTRQQRHPSAGKIRHSLQG